MPTDASVTVVKLGGSLLTLPDIPDRLCRLLEATDGLPLLIAGGGGLADQIRSLDAIHHWPAEASHALATRTLSVTAHVVASWNPRFVVVDSLSETQAVWSRGDVPVFDSSRRLLEQGDISALPAGWHVTSDSIAAWCTLQWGGERLVLAKSVSLPEPAPTVEEAAERGLVDSYFPSIARQLRRIDWVDLTASPGEIRRWRDHSRGEDAGRMGPAGSFAPT